MRAFSRVLAGAGVLDVVLGIDFALVALHLLSFESESFNDKFVKAVAALSVC